MDSSSTDAVRARIPADVDAPDRVLFGLTARQVAVLIAVAAPAYLAWRALQGRVPDLVLVAATAPVAAAAVALAVGRRDGIGLDTWLAAAVRHLRQPRRLAPAADPPTGAAWETTAAPGTRNPSPLRLPANAVEADGAIDVRGHASAAVVAATTVNTGLLAGAEQAALVATYARWLNSLTGPVQVVVSARRFDLGAHALRAVTRAERLPSPVLRGAAHAHAGFLLDLAVDRDPLSRTVTITCTAPGPVSAAGQEAARRAARTAQALSALGVRSAVLDGAAVTALLTASVDPFAAADAGWPRTPPDAVVTSPANEDGTW